MLRIYIWYVIILALGICNSCRAMDDDSSSSDMGPVMITVDLRDSPLTRVLDMPAKRRLFDVALAFHIMGSEETR